MFADQHHFQLCDVCLAPNTEGDGTGCDNMTVVVVRFKPLATKENNVTTTANGNGATADGDEEKATNGGAN